MDTSPREVGSKSWTAGRHNMAMRIRSTVLVLLRLPVQPPTTGKSPVCRERRMTSRKNPNLSPLCSEYGRSLVKLAQLNRCSRKPESMGTSTELQFTEAKKKRQKVRNAGASEPGVAKQALIISPESVQFRFPISVASAHEALGYLMLFFCFLFFSRGHTRPVLLSRIGQLYASNFSFEAPAKQRQRSRSN